MIFISRYFDKKESTENHLKMTSFVVYSDFGLILQANIVFKYSFQQSQFSVSFQRLDWFNKQDILYSIFSHTYCAYI